MQVMDPTCPGRESVCLDMMKSSTCPHSSSPLHILIITNLQTNSRGHTHRTHLPSLALSHTGRHHSLRPKVQIQLRWLDTDAGYKCLWHYKSAEYLQRTPRCQLLLAGCPNPNLTVKVQSQRSLQGAKDFLVAIWCLVHFSSQ